jgi:two-component system chemotaxis sensor kinase CheA
VDRALLRQVWPIFSAEAREHLAVIASGLLQLESEPGRVALLDPVRRTAHSLKGSAASLGLEDVEQLAHALEGLLADYDPAAGLAREAVEAGLAAITAIDAALAAGDAGAPPAVEGLVQVLAALGFTSGAPARATGAAPPRPGGTPLPESLGRPLASLERAVELALRPGVDGAEAAELAGAWDEARRLVDQVPSPARPLAERVALHFRELGAGGAEPGRRVAALAGALVDLREQLERGGQATAPPPPVPVAERSVRVLTSTIDALARQLELLALGEARHGRRAREVAALEAGHRDGLRALDQALELARGKGLGAARGALDAALGRLREVGGSLRTLARQGHREAEQQWLTGRMLREDLRALRLVPAALLLEPMRLAAQELARRLGKQATVELHGAGVKLDRRVVDALRDPLLHLVRNAVDHGLEPPPLRLAAGKPEAGRITVRVEPRGSRVGLQVEDDGAGLDLGAIRARAVERGLLPDAAEERSDQELARLIFKRGLSTAAAVTTISGRGIGLDVVLEAITRLGGAVDVASIPGRSTRFDLDLPLTLAATPALLLRSGQALAAIPADVVERVVLLAPGDLAAERDRFTARVGEHDLPFATLEGVLGLPEGPPPMAARPSLVLSVGALRAVVAVDEVIAQLELQVESLGRRVEGVAHLAGAAQLDDGRIVGMLNAAELLRRIGPGVPRGPDRAPLRVVVADDALATRLTVKALLEEEGYVVVAAADGQEALEMAQAFDVALVITDVEMPRLDGLGLARALRALPRRPAIRVVMMTSLGAPAARAAGLAAGADAYLVKREVTPATLLELLRRLVAEGG